MCFAVPVYDYSRRVIGTVGLSVLSLDYTLESMIRDLGPKVMKTGKEISLQMGMSKELVEHFVVGRPKGLVGK